METFEQREFPMRDEDFWSLSRIAYQHTGIVLGEHKKNLVYGRLSRRLRRLSLKNFAEYVALLESGNPEEFDEFVNTVTTNLTSFFRENHHFAFLKTTIFSDWVQSGKSNFLIWSAGCSTGEEPYSIAITVTDHFPKPKAVKILATDLDANVLRHARNGVYEYSRIEGLEKSLLSQHFQRDKQSNTVLVKPHLREKIVFNRLNLLGNWPMKKKFDVIFCRNVLIYFDKETQTRLVARYVDQLSSRGYLIIGHSENITRLNTDLEFVGQTIYRRRT